MYVSVFWFFVRIEKISLSSMKASLVDAKYLHTLNLGYLTFLAEYAIMFIIQ